MDVFPYLRYIFHQISALGVDIRYFITGTVWVAIFGGTSCYIQLPTSRARQNWWACVQKSTVYNCDACRGAKYYLCGCLRSPRNAAEMHTRWFEFQEAFMTHPIFLYTEYYI